MIPPCFAFGIVICFLCPLWLIASVGLVCLGGIGLCWFLPALRMLIWIFMPTLMGIIIGYIYFITYYEARPITKIHYGITISGTITDIQDNADKPRIVLKLDSTNKNNNKNISDEAQNISVTYVRLNISPKEYALVNYHDHLTAKVFLAPPAPALFEGAYDFEFYAKLHGFGATGRIEKIINHTKNTNYSLAASVHTLRLKIAKIIAHTLHIDTASPIIAMITGSRFIMPEHIQNAWKASGIYHLLSISGLHITIVAGICFVFVRHFLLLFPPLAYGGRLKKVTAVCTMPLTYGYVLLSGGDVPVIRAYIMVCVGLIAILCNQRMITLRSACVAFCLVLIINPIDIFNIGFALSFAAVLGIIIAVNMVNFLKSYYHFSKITHFMIINMAAGYAGFPLAIFVFNSNAVLGIVTNMIAVPLSGTIMMPLMIISVCLMPFDLYEYPLMMTGFCVYILNELSFYMADFSISIFYTQAPHKLWIVLFYTAMYLLAINTKKSVKIGIIGVICAFVGHILTPQNDYLHLRNDKTHFYVNAKNELIQLVRYDKNYVNPYVIEQVLLHFGRSPQSVYYYQKCDYKQTYTTLLGYQFKC